MNRLTPREGVSVEELGASDGRKFFAILDNKRQKRLLLVVGRVNEALLVGRRDRQIVRFSKREHSPHLSDEIWVSTLAHYRKGENLEGDQCDPMEGRVKLDATPFFAGWLPESGFGHAVSSLSAKAEHGLICDPWVYCTAFCPYGERDAYGLGKRISSDNDTITNILDVNAFALELGVGFAVTLDPATHLKAVPGLSLIEKVRAAHSEYKRIVHVDHGPVAYEDVSGTLDTSGQPAGLSSPAGFIKPKSFSYQAEYRFALQIIGEPSIATLRIPVSDALRQCTSLR
ncbi:MAG: hypothetical protein F4089_04440 [Gammaproteobacteria bacterium]|nr:hypothetical protein [Gammaproteobacteria bacterium]MYC87149.1 hypothetical protein [Candidatus Palauibacter denitrificans]MYJ74381.1 hypothetical protein [Gammaproteobacteria bacterium]